MTKRLTQLAMVVAGLVLLVASVDYQRLMGRQHVTQQVQRQLAKHVATRLLADLPELARGEGCSVGLLEFDTDGLVTEVLRHHVPASRSTSTLNQNVSDISASSITVEGQIEEWVTDPLPAARLKVTLRITDTTGHERTRRYTVTAADGLTLEPMESPLTWWQRSQPSLDTEATQTSWLWMVLAMALPWIVMEAVLSLLRTRPWLLTSVLAVAYLVGVVWAAQMLWQQFEQQRGLWGLVVLGSCWVLMHFDDGDAQGKPEALQSFKS